MALEPNSPYRGIKSPVPSPMLGGSFNIDQFWSAYNTRKMNMMVQQANQQAANRKAFRENYSLDKLYPKELYAPTRDQVVKEIDDLAKRKAELESSGIDLYQNPEFEKEFANTRARILGLQSAGKEIQDMTEAAGKIVEENPDQFNYNDYTSILQNAVAIPDPSKKKEYLQGAFAEFFTPKFDPVEWAAELIPKPETNGAYTEVSKEDFMGPAVMKLSRNKAELDSALKQAKDAGMPHETVQDAAEYIYKSNEDEFYRNYKPGKTSNSEAAKEAKLAARNFGAGGSKKFTMVPQSKYPASEGRADYVAFDGLTPQRYETPDGGNLILGGQVNAFVGNDGKWHLQGESMKVVGQSPIREGVDLYQQKAEMAAKYGVSEDKVIADKGVLTAYGSGTMQVVDLDRNEASFKAASGNADFYGGVKNWEAQTDLSANKQKALAYSGEQKSKMAEALATNEAYLSSLKKLDPKASIMDDNESKSVAKAIKRVEEVIADLKKKGASSQEKGNFNPEIDPN